MFLVSTIGRCGSSMFIFNLERLSLSVPQGKAKNHWYPNRVENHNPPISGAIFLFGDIIDVVLSVKRCQERFGDKWIDKHNINLNGDYENRYNFLNQDSFYLEKMFDSWMRPQKFPLLTLKYESMWENEDLIKQFLNYPDFKLPDFDQSGNKHGSGKEDRFFRRIKNRNDLLSINRTYSSLIKKVNEAPVAKIW